MLTTIMNYSFSPYLAASFYTLGFWWCLFSLLLGVFIGWLIWRNAAKEVEKLEQENAKVKKDAERRERILTSNRELLAALTDAESDNA